MCIKKKEKNTKMLKVHWIKIFSFVSFVKKVLFGINGKILNDVI